ncbi:hypothetical protein OG21DRAFT_1491669 [Imleria badia]|nr:hypothetical protein OG21DRAFT_1491669 [Imleria badia]
MSTLEARECLVTQVLKAIDEKEKARHDNSDPTDDLRKKWERTSPSNHYHVAESSRNPVDLTVWLGSHLEDRVTKGF